jgi:hypothetical protein
MGTTSRAGTRTKLTPGQEGITKMLAQAGLPYTRENWIRTNWPDHNFGPEGWTAEHEDELPPDLRR